MIARTVCRRHRVAQRLVARRLVAQRLIVVLSSFLLLTTGAVASALELEETPYAQSGPYVGIAAGVAIESATDSDVQDSYAVGGWIGYRALPLLAVELQVEHTTAANLKGKSGGLESVVWTANSRLYLGTGRVQPFALLGLGMSIGMEKASSKIGNNADVALRAGGGFQAHITNGLAVVVSGNYLGSFQANRHLDYGSATVGLQYQF